MATATATRVAGAEPPSAEPTIVLKAFRFALDPTASQLPLLSSHAGSARWAYNYAIARKQATHQEWLRQVEEAVSQGATQAEARKRVKLPVPTKPTIYKQWGQERGDSRREDGEGVCPWWHEVNSYAFQSAFIDADNAWSNWINSFRGKRAGRRVGYPRFKRKGKSRDSFRLHHDVKKPAIRLSTYRRLRLPRIGEVRLHESAKRLGRLITKGEAVIQSVTVSRGGHRWYASILCKVTAGPDHGRTTRTQRANGKVGVHLGINPLAVLSRPWPNVPGNIGHSVVENPRWLEKSTKRLVKAQRDLSRKAKGSQRRVRAARRVGRIHHLIAEQRTGYLHGITKRLATTFDQVGLYDMDILSMVPAPRRKAKKPPNTSDLNRRLLDTAPGEFRRQLEYKTFWYGSRLALLDREFSASKTCSECGGRKPSLTLADRVFHCDHCGLRLPRGVNAARNIAAHATVATGPDGPAAPRKEEAKNARGAPIRLPTPRGEQQEATKREGGSPSG